MSGIENQIMTNKTMTLFKLKPVAQVDFKSLVRPKSPNTYLAGIPGHTSAALDQEAPIFKCSIEQLMAKWNELITSMPRVEKLDDLDADGQRTFVHRTALMRYPDILTVRFLDLGGEESSLLLYSRSQYGYSDIGTNRRRVRKLLGNLSKTLI